MHPAAELAFTTKATSTPRLQKLDGKAGLRTCREVLGREPQSALPHGDVVVCGGRTYRSPPSKHV